MEIIIALFICKGDGLTIFLLTLIVYYYIRILLIQVIYFAWFNKKRVSRDTYPQYKIHISVLQSIKCTFSGFSFVVSHV